VLVTGHTGFKGSWLSAWLHRLGAEVSGLSLEPDENQRTLFDLVEKSDTFRHSVFGDIRDQATVASAFERAQPEIVFHLAAQPLVRLSYETPIETYATNVMGTLNVLEAVRTFDTSIIVCVTTDKCYENTEQIWPYRETDPMGGWDPYSSSKGAAEIAIASFRRSFFSEPGSPACASARAGNVVGGGDKSADRLLPDMFRAMQDGDDLALRRPNAERPWQHVLECLSGYLALAVGLKRDPESFSEGWNFGPDPSERTSVGEFVTAVSMHLGPQGPTVSVHDDGPHEAGRLALDITKAAERLAWRPTLTLDQRARLTAEWFLAELDGTLTSSSISTQLADFEEQWLTA